MPATSAWRARLAVLALAPLLAACGAGMGGAAPPLSEGMPGVNVATAALAAGVPDLALTVSRDILAKSPGNAEARLAEADALGSLGRAEEAEASYARVLARSPGAAPALVGLGRLRLRRDPRQAQLLFLTALQSEPRNTAALNDLGIALDLQGDHAAAQECYRRVLGLDPRSQAAEVNLALSMALDGKAAEAVRLLRPYAADPGAAPRVRHDLAAAMTLTGDPSGAARMLDGDMTPQQVEQTLQAYQALAK